jgi:cell fate regulator YaaT (PSP1 superfamily)
MCCLKYEQDAYEELLKKSPNVGALVDTPMGRGTVIASQLLKGIVSVKKDTSDTVVNDFKVDDIVIIKNTHRTNNQKEEVDAKALAELEKD